MATLSRVFTKQVKKDIFEEGAIEQYGEEEMEISKEEAEMMIKILGSIARNTQSYCRADITKNGTKFFTLFTDVDKREKIVEHTDITIYGWE